MPLSGLLGIYWEARPIKQEMKVVDMTERCPVHIPDRLFLVLAPTCKLSTKAFTKPGVTGGKNVG